MLKNLDNLAEDENGKQIHKNEEFKNLTEL